MSEQPGLPGWHRFIGRWETEGAHPMLPGEPIRGTSTFEWLDGQRFVIWRSHYDHSQIPDAITIIGVTDGQLSMHYFDHARRVPGCMPPASIKPRGGIGVTRLHPTSPSASPAPSATTEIRSRVVGSCRRTGMPGRTILISPITGWREPQFVPIPSHPHRRAQGVRRRFGWQRRDSCCWEDGRERPRELGSSNGVTN